MTAAEAMACGVVLLVFVLFLTALIGAFRGVPRVSRQPGRRARIDAVARETAARFTGKLSPNVSPKSFP